MAPIKPNLLRFNLGAPNSQLYQYSDSLKASAKPNSMKYNLGAPYSQESNIFYHVHYEGLEMSTAISETIRKTNKHLIRESFLFLTENLNAGGPQEGPLQPIVAPNLLYFLFFFFFLGIFSRTADLLGPPINPLGPPFWPPFWAPLGLGPRQRLTR